MTKRVLFDLSQLPTKNRLKIVRNRIQLQIILMNGRHLATQRERMRKRERERCVNISLVEKEKRERKRKNIVFREEEFVLAIDVRHSIIEIIHHY